MTSVNHSNSEVLTLTQVTIAPCPSSLGHFTHRHAGRVTPGVYVVSTSSHGELCNLTQYAVPSPPGLAHALAEAREIVNTRRSARLPRRLDNVHRVSVRLTQSRRITQDMCYIHCTDCQTV